MDALIIGDENHKNLIITKDLFLYKGVFYIIQDIKKHLYFCIENKNLRIENIWESGHGLAISFYEEDSYIRFFNDIKYLSDSYTTLLHNHLSFDNTQDLYLPLIDDLPDFLLGPYSFIKFRDFMQNKNINYIN